MVEIVGARLGVGWGWDLGEHGWKPGVDDNWRLLDTLTGLSIISDVLTAPPGSPANGDTYLVATGGTGAWATHDAEVTSYQAGTWYFYPVTDGLRAWFVNHAEFRHVLAGTWTPEAVPTNFNLDDLLDVNTGGATTGDVLTFDGTSWVPDTSAPAVSSLDDLSDVATAGAVSGNILGFNGTSWVPGTVAAPGVPALNDLTDVDTTGVVAGNVLAFDGTNWVDATVIGLSAIGAGHIIGNGGTAAAVPGDIALHANLVINAGTLAIIAGPAITAGSGNGAVKIVAPGTTAISADSADDMLRIVGPDGLGIRVIVDTYGGVPNWSSRRANGTRAVPTAVVTNDVLYRMAAIAHQGTAYAAGKVAIAFVATETWTPTANGSAMDFQTTADGATAVTTAMRIQGAFITVGTTAVSGTDRMQIAGGLSVDGTKHYGRNAGVLLAQWVLGAVVANGVFHFVYKAPYAGKITSLNSVSATGTFTVAVAINGTPVTGLGAVAVTATPDTASATAALTFVAGDDITGTITLAASSPTNSVLNLNVAWT